MTTIKSAARTDDYLARELLHFAKRFDLQYESFLQKEIKNAPLRERVLYAVRLIGVRERAMLVRISSNLCQTKWNTVLPAALAAECFIASALTGDDIVDRAEVRWNKPTVWKRWGEDQAWLVTEMLHALAQAVTDRLRHPPAIQLLRSVFKRFFEGQFREILPGNNHSPKEAVDLAMERSGGLLQACLMVPAMISESSFLKPLTIYGRNFGTAFQLADDIYDFLGSPSVMGKPILGDLLNGQPNIVLSHVFEQPDSSPKQSVTAWFGRGTADRPDNAGPILEAVKALGSISFAADLIRLHIKRARNALARIPSGKQQRLLDGFLELISLLPVSNGG